MSKHYVSFHSSLPQTPKYKPLKPPEIRQITNSPQKCFIGNHIAEAGFPVPPGPSLTIFKDYTCNHNKALLEFETAAPDLGPGVSSIDIAIRTRGMRFPITFTLPQGRLRNLQIEDLESVVVSNSGTDNSTFLRFNINKTFCICCKNKRKKGVQPIAHMGECFIDTHVILDQRQIITPNGATHTVFENLTCNHNKTFLVLSTTNAPVSVDVKTRKCNKPIPLTIAPPGFRIIQVEDFESLNVTNLSNDVPASFFLHAQKTFCICCNSEDNTPKDHKNCSCGEKCHGSCIDCTCKRQ